MPCTAPIIVEHPETRLRSEVACGQCRSCRLRRKLQWVGRLLLENRQHVISRFITLTYAHDPGVLDYYEFQCFMKRYRKEYGDVRFFCVGEYGSNNGRGHYHAILFGHAPETRGYSLSLQRVWKLGFCYDGTVSKDSIGYVSGYVFKENYAPGKMPFVRMSLKPGIGMEAISEMGQRAAEHKLRYWPSDYKIDGKTYPLCQGGLARFKLSYIENGGLPPSESNPITRDILARTRASYLGRGGSRLSEESDRSMMLAKRYTDEQAIKKLR